MTLSPLYILYFNLYLHYIRSYYYRALTSPVISSAIGDVMMLDLPVGTDEALPGPATAVFNPVISKASGEVMMFDLPVGVSDGCADEPAFNRAVAIPGPVILCNRLDEPVLNSPFTLPGLIIPCIRADESVLDPPVAACLPAMGEAKPLPARCLRLFTVALPGFIEAMGTLVAKPPLADRFPPEIFGVFAGNDRCKTLAEPAAGGLTIGCPDAEGWAVGSPDVEIAALLDLDFLATTKPALQRVRSPAPRLDPGLPKD
jgi:hypothetical protein